jgi:signal transduction histidine kinase
MNKRRILLIALVILSVSLMFFYRSASLRQVMADPTPAELYPLSQDQKVWLSAKKELVIAVTDDSAPLIMLDSHRNASGILVDYLDHFRSSYHIEISYVPIVKRDLEAALVDGQADAALAMHDLALDKTISYTMPVVEVKGVLLYQNTMSLAASPEGRGFVIACVEGDPSEDAIRELFPKAELLLADSTEDAVGRLKSGDANAVAGSETALNYFLGMDYISNNLLRADGYLYEKNYSLAVAAENNILFEILNNAIYYMDNARVLTNLQSKWMGMSYQLYTESFVEKIGIIILILFAAVLCVFLVFYQSNKSLYEELQQRMELLIESQNEMQTTFDGVTYYLAEVNREGKIVDINKALAQYLQIRRHNAIGLKLPEVLGADEVASSRLSELIEKTFLEEKEHDTEFTVGRGIYEAHSFTIKDTRGKVQKILLMIMDVTDQRSAERQMLQDNKMIAVGQLASGVAHEIRNPLGLIRNYSYVLKSIEGNDPATREEAIKIIEKSVEKAGSIIENLLNFSRMTSNKKELVNLYVHISNTIDLQRNWLDKRGITVYYRFTGSHDVVVNIEAIELVLVNLISNAADAISRKESEDGMIEITCEHAENQHIRLIVRDNGEGIPEEIKEDIFNPFFSTKEKKEGNGLGLYIVYNEVSKMQGDIKVDSQIGEGTTFTITIPVDRNRISAETATAMPNHH